MDEHDLLRALRQNATSIDELDAPARPGVYAYFLTEGAALPRVDAGEARLLYVGMSGDLAQREFDTHFAAGQTGFSTLRRSFGAILKETLGLQCRPRGTGASPSNYTNYRFDDGGEQRLSEWMRAHVLVATHAVDPPKPVEDKLIAAGRPPLNLKGWPNPHAAAIRALRKQCADEARRDHPR